MVREKFDDLTRNFGGHEGAALKAKLAITQSRFERNEMLKTPRGGANTCIRASESQLISRSGLVENHLGFG